MSEHIIPSEQDVTLWWSNLDPEIRGAVSFDHRDRFERDFPAANHEENLDWLQEEHVQHYDDLVDFVEQDHGQLVKLLREKAADHASDDLQVDEFARVIVPTAEELDFKGGAFVATWKFIRIGLEVEVGLWTDDQPECPNAWGGWRLWSFNSRHNSFKHPNEFNMDSAEFKKAEQAGLIFRLGYYEHGQCSWFLQGEGGVGTNCQFDGVTFAGLLVWADLESKPWDGHVKRSAAGTHILTKSGKKISLEKSEWLSCAKRTARQFAEAYTTWANGEVIGYTIEDTPGVDGGSCGGFYSLKYAVGEVLDQLPVHAEILWKGIYENEATDAEHELREKRKKDGEP